MRNIFAAIFSIFIASAFSPVISGNNDEPLRGAYVIAYKDEGFKGESIRFSIGEYKDLNGDWDDEIESIALVGPVRVILFDDDDFEGDKLMLEQSAYELEDLDEDAGSLIVEPFNCSSVAVYKNTVFKGKYKNFHAGEYPKLNDGWSGNIESVDLCGGVKITLFEDENFEGASLQIEQDQIDLGDFNGRAESMIVEVDD
jgi:hypothetical protein